MLREIFKILTTPNDYGKDWYGFATNQIAHASIGIFLTWLVCVASWWISGDLPDRIDVFLGIAFVYAAKEIFLDRWQGRDTVEDFVFVVAYGAGGTLLAFQQIEPRSDIVTLKITEALPVLAVFSLHLFVGIVERVKGAVNVD